MTTLSVQSSDVNINSEELDTLQNFRPTFLSIMKKICYNDVIEWKLITLFDKILKNKDLKEEEYDFFQRVITSKDFAVEYKKIDIDTSFIYSIRRMLINNMVKEKLMYI